MMKNQDGDDESVVDYDSASGPISRASTPPMSRFPSSHSYNAYPESVSYSHSSSAGSVDDDPEGMDVDRHPSASARPSQHLPHPYPQSIIHRNPVHQRPVAQLPQHHHSDGGSEDDYEEAVTPPPAPAPVPPPPVNFASVPRVIASGRNRMDVGFLTGSSDSVSSEDLRGAQPAMSKQEDMHVDVGRPKIEDAMLLLGFSKQVQ